MPSWHSWLQIQAGVRRGLTGKTTSCSTPRIRLILRDMSKRKQWKRKRAAYCFCPVIRARLDAGMPVTYCYCGAGWYRQQWETATGMPVRVEVVRSVLKGDDVCSFAVHLADEL